MIRNLLRLIGLLGLGLVAGCGGGDNPAATKTATPPAPALAISSAAPPSGGVGTSYAGNGFSLTASGGNVQRRFDVNALRMLALMSDAIRQRAATAITFCVIFIP